MEIKIGLKDVKWARLSISVSSKYSGLFTKPQWRNAVDSSDDQKIRDQAKNGTNEHIQHGRTIQLLIQELDCYRSLSRESENLPNPCNRKTKGRITLKLRKFGNRSLQQ